MNSLTKNNKIMYQPDFGNGHSGVYMFIGTLILYIVSVTTMHELAGLATILAGLTTAAVNIKKFLKK